MKIRYIPFSVNAPDWNMAIDEYLLRKFLSDGGMPSIRFYGFDPVSVTLGYHQNRVPGIFKRYPAVKRPTGGRAVLHKGDLVYSVVGSHQEGYFAGSIFETYKKIASLIVRAFRRHGFDAELSAGSPQSHTELCFDSTTRYEITLNGKKIVGAAQVRRKNAFLEQGSIQFFEVDREILSLSILEEFKNEGFEVMEMPLTEAELDEVNGLLHLYPIIRPEK